jgi:hypothetical protein
MVMLAMMVAALSFTACGGDDLGGGSSNFIIGTWSVTSIQESDGYKLTFDGEVEYIQFQSNGTYICILLEKLDITKGTWRISDNDLIVKLSTGEIETYPILNLTNSSLTIESHGITWNLTKVPDSYINKYIK